MSTTSLQDLKRLGEELGLAGAELMTFISKQQEIDRDKRASERDAEKEKILAEKEKERIRLDTETQRTEQIKLKLQLAKHQHDNGEDNSDDDQHGLSEMIGNRPTFHNQRKAKGPKLTPYDDRDDIDSYIVRFEKYANAEQWGKDSWAVYLSALLRGRALDVYARLPITEANNYDKLKQALLKRFEKTEEGYRRQFYSSKPEVGETPKQFIIRLGSYFFRYVELSQIEPTFDGLGTLLVREQYLSTCSRDLEVFLRERAVKDLDELSKLAEQYLEAHKNKSGNWTRSQTEGKATTFQEQSSSQNSERQSKKPVYSTDGRKHCWHCNSTQHLGKDCPMKVKKRAMAMTSMEGEAGDDAKETAAMSLGNRKSSWYGNQERQYTNQDRQYGDFPTQSRGHVPDRQKCTVRCRQHNKEMCHECNCITEGPDHTCNAMQSEFCELRCGCKIPVIADACKANENKNMPVSSGKVNGKEVVVLRDTGCSTVVIKRDLVDESQLTGAQQTCVLIDGTIRRVPLAKIHIETDYYSGEVDAVCMRNPIYDLILGNIPSLSMKVESPDLTESQNRDVQCEESRAKHSEEIEKLEAVITRSMSANEGKPIKPLKVKCDPLDVPGSKDDFLKLQTNDTELMKYWPSKNQKSDDDDKFIVKNKLLYRVATEKNSQHTQLVLPKKVRESVLKIGHESLMSGHLGIGKTKDRILSSFWYPGITMDIVRYCKSCDICQRTIDKSRVPKVPLGQMPIINTPFERIAVDLIGEIKPKSNRGHRWILTVVDYATRYPEAVPLKTISTEAVAEALIEIFSRVGIPKEVVSDQGSQFVSDVMKEVSRLLSLKQLVTSPYHPMCNGLVERYNATLKSMLKRMCAEQPTEWDRYIAPLLFAYRGVKQESLGFTPFELLYGRNVRGPVQVLKELWSNDDIEPDTKLTYEYVIDLKNRIAETCELARSNLEKAQVKQKRLYNLKAHKREFKIGSRVLVLKPTSHNKLLMQWQGPFKVISKERDNDYKIDINGRLRLYHANMLKEYIERSETGSEDEEPDDCMLAVMSIIEDDPENEYDITIQKELPSETYLNVDINPDLEECHKQRVIELVEEFKDIFSDQPKITNLGEHEIRLTSIEPVRSKPYPLPYAMRDKLDKEIERMMDMGVIEKSTSAYSSPVVMVNKPDGSIRVCCDYRKLNKVTIFDPEPMTTTEDIFSVLHGGKYFSKFDMSKGFWQVKVRDSDKEYTTFCTHNGLFQFKVMPFGLVNSPATYSRIMRRLLEASRGLHNFMDDVLAHSESWDVHIEHLRELFIRVRNANMSLRPTKCSIGYTTVQFLGFNISEGGIKPAETLIEKMVEAPRPKTKKQLRSFLGLIGFYRSFVPHFATVAAPLTDLTKKNAPNNLIWEPVHERAFRTLRSVVTNKPVLQLPDFSKQFVLQTDASGEGLGAILLQEIDGFRHPVAFASRRLLKREQNYATIEKECLAVVWGILKFQSFLYGQHFILEVDHEPLQYLTRTRFQNSRLMRWSLILQQYRFTITYIKGSDNVGADFLSRHTITDEVVPGDEE